jgi:hybrid cluster-associated redox disulfide protein
MIHAPLSATQIVGDLLRRWPATARVFQRHGMACTGCMMAPFETIGEAAAGYGVPIECLLEALKGAIDSDAS